MELTHIFMRLKLKAPNSHYKSFIDIFISSIILTEIPSTDKMDKFPSKQTFFLSFPFSEDFVSSFFVAFSNDTREWTVLHDGYAEWVSLETINNINSSM